MPTSDPHVRHPEPIVPMTPREHHLGVLDGWRGISILLVLAAHLLPLGPKLWKLNDTAGPMGMALFFTLSGFLITRLLLGHMTIPDFLIRRLCRIVPLAWLTMLVSFALAGTPPEQWLPNFLFYANLPPIRLADVAGHFWSLCVEMQFYMAIALVVGFAGTRGLLLLPLLCIAVTANRVIAGAHVDIVTWYRVDEILAGGVLALAYGGRLGQRIPQWIARTPLWLALVVFAVASHPGSGAMNYLRPYAAAAVVGTTLWAPTPRVAAVLCGPALRYIASISFALYVFHGLLVSTWLGTGDRLAKYAKRPLLIAATFALAHVSTFHFERYWIDWGKRMSKWNRRAPT